MEYFTSPGSTQSRNDFFQKLKPCCVRISQLAIRDALTSTSTRELAQLTTQLYSLLEDQVRSGPAALDEKLAEYIFFPLYHVFRNLDKCPMPLIENCIKCVSILIYHGWKSKLTWELAQQLLSLLVYIIDGVPGSSAKRDLSEEAALESFKAMTAVFKTAKLSAKISSKFSEADSIPALGHAIAVMNDTAVDGPSPAVQQAALVCLQNVYITVKGHETLANFLPGTVSTLTRILSSPASYKKLVLVGCFEVYQVVLTRTLGDMALRPLVAMLKTQSPAEATQTGPMSSAWLQSTQKRVKEALIVVCKIRSYDEPEVQSSLLRLCVTLLDECHTTLSDCQELLLETAMALETDTGNSTVIQTSLKDLIGIYPELETPVKSILYNWLLSLPRLMHSSDQTQKERAIETVTRGIALLRALGIESSTLDDSLLAALRDSTVVLLSDSKPAMIENTEALQLSTNAASAAVTSRHFSPAILPAVSEKDTRSRLLGLIGNVASTNDKTGIIDRLLEHSRESSGDTQLASFWLCFEMLKAAQQSCCEFDDLLDVSALSEPMGNGDSVLNELYSFSVDMIDCHAELGSDQWRITAIALEVVAFAAERSGRAFRPELIDVLFPIATLLGSDSGPLQQHAISTLNSVAFSSGYENVSAMVIDNVDYMVNSVALRLNSLDVSPASTRVLLMMMRLTGPRLVPYLDDVIDSIFAALENFHGYPLFVKDLFQVLKEVVDQGVESKTLLLEGQKEAQVDHRKKPAPKEDLQSLIEAIRKRKRMEATETEDTEDLGRGSGHPREPWKSKHEQHSPQEDNASAQQPEPEKTPNSPTYQLLLRISSLTQHYLTSPTPELRRSLLELVATASRGLAADQDAFLPLVNTLWPVVIERLYDPEPFVPIEACRTLAALCAAAGDFLSGRFRDAWASGLGKWCLKVKKEASRKPSTTLGTSTSSPSYPTTKPSREQQGLLIPVKSAIDDSGNNTSSASSASKMITSSAGGTSNTATSTLVTSGGSLGHHAFPVRTWEAVVKLLTAIVTYVRVDEAMFDEILDLLADVMERNEQVKQALETINADAVWLVRYQRGLVEKLPTPQVAGVVFVDM